MPWRISLARAGSKGPRLKLLSPNETRDRERLQEQAEPRSETGLVPHLRENAAKLLLLDSLEEDVVVIRSGLRPVGPRRQALGRELDALRESEEALYVSKRGRLAGVLLDAERYAELLERHEYLEDSLAALQARDVLDAAVPWAEVRE